MPPWPSDHAGTAQLTEPWRPVTSTPHRSWNAGSPSGATTRPKDEEYELEEE